MRTAPPPAAPPRDLSAPPLRRSPRQRPVKRFYIDATPAAAPRAFPVKKLLLLLAVLGAAGLALLLAGCSRSAAPASSGPKLTKVVLQTDWFAEPEHGGFYQALVKGYYREAGLDVEIRQGSPSTHPPQVIATGQADFAIGRSDDVSIFVSRGVPVVYVGAYMQRDPQAIVYHEESGIKSFKDLAGRNIMAVPGSAFISIMEKRYGIKVAITPSDYGVSRFLADPNFVQQCFITNEPYYLRQQGAKIGVLPLWGSGYSPYRVWFARKDFVQAHPDIVKAFCAATLRGWHDYASGDHAAADARIGELNPKMTPDFVKFSAAAMQEYQLIAGDPQAGEALGRIDPARVARELQQLSDIGQLDRPLKVDEVLDPHFLP